MRGPANWTVERLPRVGGDRPQNEVAWITAAERRLPRVGGDRPPHIHIMSLNWGSPAWAGIDLLRAGGILDIRRLPRVGGDRP